LIAAELILNGNKPEDLIGETKDYRHYYCCRHHHHQGHSLGQTSCCC